MTIVMVIFYIQKNAGKLDWQQTDKNKTREVREQKCIRYTRHIYIR